MSRRRDPESWQPSLAFEALPFDDEALTDDEALVIDLEGWEGPLHVLLALARTQKVDLLKLSITRLAEQYLAFVQAARKHRFALAADYLVMASWLAWLKSRLLLPRTEKAEKDEAPAEVMAAALAFRLRKLAAMREAVAALQSRPQLGRDVFGRGDPEVTVVTPSSQLDVSLHALMTAYVTQRRRDIERTYAPPARIEAYPVDDARRRLRALLPRLDAWTGLSAVAPEPDAAEDGPSRASYLASTLSASLELVREGALRARQLQPFDEVWLRRGEGEPAEAAA